MPRVPALSRDETLERLVRAVALVMVGGQWRGKEGDFAAMEATAAMFEDYVFDRVRVFEDADLIEQIRGKRK